GRWTLQVVGALELLPPQVAARLRSAGRQGRTEGGLHVNIAVGYGGRREIADAVKAFLQEGVDHGRSLAEVAQDFSVEHIAQHLYTKGQPDPDLVIRTSGEQRLSGFLMWQSAHSEFYFCDAYWPDFRHVDFIRALRAYSQRERRRGR
ncbi:MAG TPA: polyprenyl diphosphate synthase, partial [Demequinaceae bacterium]